MSYQRVTLRICLVLLSLMINDVINLESTSQRQSGVHVENGDDHMTIHRLPTDEKLVLDHVILKLPGKPKRPIDKHLLIKRSGPKFLLNVYKYKANKDSEKKPNESVELSEYDLTENVMRTIDQSDVIITFMGEHGHQGAGGKPEGIWFDIHAVSVEEQITSAELRLYRGLDAKNRKNHGAFTVEVYRVLRTNDERQLQFVDSAKTTAGHEGWITLNVTESLIHWLKHPDDNKGLYLSVRPIDRSTYETRPEDVGIVGLEGDPEREPFMVGFSRKNESDNSADIQQMLQSFKNYNKRNKKRDTSDQRSGSSCKVEDLYVSFKDLDWEDRIIAPEGYYANECSGECKYPLYNVEDFTYHAIILSRGNMLHPEKIRTPCCAPTKLSGIDVIYIGHDNIFIKKKFNNMSVKECGCH